MDSQGISAKIRVKRFSAGLYPAMKMLRVNTGWGSIADRIFAARGTDLIGDDYFTSLVNIHSMEGNAGVAVLNPKKERLLTVQATEVGFWASNYTDNEAQISLNNSFEQFLQIWQSVDEVLRMRDIRRISFAVSFEVILSTSANEYLFGHINQRPPVNPTDFQLQYQSRKWPDRDPENTEMPSLETDALINQSFAYYAGNPKMPQVLATALGPTALSVAGPVEKRINIDLEVSRFYSPLMASGNGGAFRKQFNSFHEDSDKTKAKIEADLNVDGVSVDG